jgi:hypothetical protein
VRSDRACSLSYPFLTFRILTPEEALAIIEAYGPRKRGTRALNKSLPSQ